MKKIVFGSILLVLIILGVAVIYFANQNDSTDLFAYQVKDPQKTHFIVISDTHTGSGFSLKLNPSDIPKGDNTIFTGDIFEVTWAKKGEKENAAAKARKLRETFGDSYIRGNHEGDAFNSIIIDESKTKEIKVANETILFSELDYAIRSVKNQKILFVHGHKGIDPKYTSDKIKEVENSSVTKSFLFQLFSPIGAWYRNLKSVAPSDQKIKNAINLAESMDCQIIVFGHTHVNRLFDKTFESSQNGTSVRVINVPRGVTHLEL